MSRLFVANFGFEDELTGRRMSRSASEATRGLCGCWTPMLGPGDRIVLGPSESDAEAVQGAGRVTEIVPWGWSRCMARLAQAAGTTAGMPDPLLVETLNRRRWLFAREVELGMAPAGSALLESLDDCLAVLSRPPAIGSAWIVKADLGASGRCQRRVGDVAAGGGSLQKWISRCLERDGVVLVEPYLESVCEYGLQFELSAGERIRFCGATELLTTESGGYRGTRFSGRAEGPLTGELDELLAVVEPVVLQVARSGYTGPLGVDSMRYRRSSAETGWRPLQDINARFTMGRCALEWSGELPRGTSGTVLVGRWVDAMTVDRRLAGLLEQVEGLQRARRFSPRESPPRAPTGLVLLVYDERLDPGPIECRVTACLEEPAG